MIVLVWVGGFETDAEIRNNGVVKSIQDEHELHEERRTRDRVVRLILENGPSSATTLGTNLGLTPAAVRRHLDALLAEGIVEPREERLRGQRGRGRPARLFAITDAGRRAFQQDYDDLAVSAMRFLAALGGDEAVDGFARSRVADLERRYGPALASLPVHQRVQALAEALSADGYAASASSGPTGVGEQLCQHHCPVAHVAEEFPQLCEAETEVFARLLDAPVQRLATIAHGDGVCTTHISVPAQHARQHPSNTSTTPKTSTTSGRTSV
jgi:predicted ArsR family transcriptional regulator